MRFLEGDAHAGPRLAIQWDNGRQQQLSASFLRAKCPCETCKLATLKLEPAMFPGLVVDSFDLVGRYALQLHFSDGHRHGAFSFDLLQTFPDEA